MTAVFIELTGKDSKCLVNINSIFIVNPEKHGVCIEFTDESSGDFSESYDIVTEMIAQATGKIIYAKPKAGDDEHFPRVRRP